MSGSSVWLEQLTSLSMPAAALLGVLLAWLRPSALKTNSIQLRNWLQRWLPALAIALLIVWGVLLRYHQLDQPFDSDQPTQRIFNATYSLNDIFAFRYNDSRHPPLYYVVLHFFSLHRLDPEWMRLPAVISTGALFVVLGVSVSRLWGGLSAFVAVLLVVISAPLWPLTNDVSDVPQYLAFALLTVAITSTVLSNPVGSTRRWYRSPAWLVAIGCAATLWTYYTGVLLIASVVITVAIHGRKRRWITPAILTAILCYEPVKHVLRTIQQDTHTRTLAEQFPLHHWGQWSVPEYITAVFELIGPTPWLAVLPAIFGFTQTARRRWTPLHTLTVVWVTASIGVVLASPSTVRMKPYYLMHIVPLHALWCGAAVTTMTGRHWLNRSIGGALVGMTLVQAGNALKSREHITYDTSVARTIQAFKAADGHHLVFDISNIYTQAIYYGLPDPVAMYRACRFMEPDRTIYCENNGFIVEGLSEQTTMATGWELRALEKWRAISSPHHFLAKKRYPNAPLYGAIAQRCEQVSGDAEVQLWYCDPEPPQDTVSPSSTAEP